MFARVARERERTSESLRNVDSASGRFPSAGPRDNTARSTAEDE